MFIPVNLGGDHWILAGADLRAKRMWIYDLLVTFRDSKTYVGQFKPFEVIFSRWLENVGFYNIRYKLQSVDLWKVGVVRDMPQQEAGSGDYDFFLLMFMMFGLRLDFSSSYMQYFRKKIDVDIFNSDIGL